MNGRIITTKELPVGTGFINCEGWNAGIYTISVFEN